MAVLPTALALILLAMTWRELHYWKMPRNLDPRHFVPWFSDVTGVCQTCSRGRWLVFMGTNGEQIYPYNGRMCACDWLNIWWDNGWRPGEEWTGPIMGKCSDWGRGP